MYREMLDHLTLSHAIYMIVPETLQAGFLCRSDNAAANLVFARCGARFVGQKGEHKVRPYIRRVASVRLSATPR